MFLLIALTVSIQEIRFLYLLPNFRKKEMNGFQDISGRTDGQTNERARAKFKVLMNFIRRTNKL